MVATDEILFQYAPSDWRTAKTACPMYVFISYDIQYNMIKIYYFLSLHGDLVNQSKRFHFSEWCMKPKVSLTGSDIIRTSLRTRGRVLLEALGKRWLTTACLSCANWAGRWLRPTLVHREHRPLATELKNKCSEINTWAKERICFSCQYTFYLLDFKRYVNIFLIETIYLRTYLVRTSDLVRVYL